MPSIFDHVAQGGDPTAYAPDAVAQNAAMGDPTPYGDQGVLPQAAATAASLSSGHALDDYARSVDPSGAYQPGLLSAPGLVARGADAIHGAVTDPAGAAAGAAKGVAGSIYSGVTLPGDVMAGKVDPTDASVLPRVLDTVGLMGGAGLPMAEEGAAGVMGGRLPAPDRYTLDASTIGDINELLGLGRDWKAPDPHAAMNNALRDFVAPQTEGYQRPPISRTLDPESGGYDVFHGTGALQDFSRFDPGVSGVNVSKHQQGAVFFSPDPQEAGAYARMGMQDGSAEQRTAGPRIIPASVDPGRTQVYDLGAMLDARDPRLLQGMQDVAGDAGHSPDSLGKMVDYELQARAARAAAGQPDKGVPLVLGAHNAAIGMARQDGLDTAVLRGLSESDGADQLAVLTPNRVRSAIDGSTLYSRGDGAAPLALAGALDRQGADAAGNALTGATNGGRYTPSRVLPAGGRAVSVATDVRHAPLDDTRTYRIYPQPEGGLGEVTRARDLGNPLGNVLIGRNDDGRWEVGMVHVNPRSRGQGVATDLYNAVEKDLGITMQPSGTLLPDGYALWNKRAPETLNGYQEMYPGTPSAYWISPKRILHDIDNFNDPGSSHYKEIRKVVDNIPPEARTPEALSKMFATGLPIPGAAPTLPADLQGTNALTGAAQPADAPDPATFNRLLAAGRAT